MAAALLQNALPPDKKGKYSISSAGTNADSGAPATKPSVEVMRELNIDIKRHKSRLLTKELTERADLILALAENHVESIKGSFPNAAGKVYLLSDYSGRNRGSSISDPYGGDADTYRTTRNEIAAHTSLIASKM